MVKPDIAEKVYLNARRMMAATGGATPVFITDRHRAPDPLAIIAGLPAHALVVCRDYDHPAREAHAVALRAATRTKGQCLLVAGDAALARRVGADGVHLPEHMLGRPPVLSGFSLVTAACHSRLALWRAEGLGVDLALVSPVFQTRSHAEAQGLGLHRLARMIQEARVPIAALGGINPGTAKQLRPLKLAAFAAIDGFLAEG